MFPFSYRSKRSSRNPLRSWGIASSWKNSIRGSNLRRFGGGEGKSPGMREVLVEKWIVHGHERGVPAQAVFVQMDLNLVPGFEGEEEIDLNPVP